jgi:iron complex outermembrane receptor protein
MKIGGAAVFVGVAIVATIGASASARGQAATRNYDLPGQSIATAIQAIARISGENVAAPAAVLRGRVSSPVRGRFTTEEALTRALAGSGLRAERASGGFVIRVDPPTDSSDNGRTHGEVGDAAIVVTGSRIRGASTASPTITLNREQIRSAGQATIAEALRTLPQNFGGGQNPGVGLNVPEGNGFDLGGGSSVNLRGLGSDATLTLLNGHRLSYSAAKQSVDLSGIPLGAVSRLDVVPDGASALFGSDAVAGVVNIILRRDLNGLETGFRLAGTSDGGNFNQIYNATGGKTWDGGHVLLAYEYGRNTPIISSQRDYAAIRPNVTIYPGIRHHSGLLSFHEDLTSNLSFSMDGLFNKRWSSIGYPRNAAGDLAISRVVSSTKAQSYGVAPSVTLQLPGDWETSLGGSFGQDKVDYGALVFAGTIGSNSGGGYYRNREKSVELSGNGTLFDLPGGRAKLALGSGYRRIDFLRFTGVGGAQNIDASQINTYGFAELNLPVVTGVVLSAAARHERYRGIGKVTTPKFGLIVSPTQDFSIKGSWGKSFRAPTLYQQYQPQGVYLLNIASVGGTGYPAGKTALLLIGGNPDVTPEKSTNWSATLDVHPRTLPGLNLELSYFSVAYRDRIVIPLPSFGVALANPVYANRVTANPSAAEQSALISSVNTFLNLSSNATYDPSQVAFIVDDSNVNAASQTIRGIDVLLRYSGAAGPGKVSSSLDMAWITSKQQIGPGLPVTQLAGHIFNPPHFRVRGDVGWTVGAVTLTTAVSYIGPVEDNRTINAVRVDGMTPIDLGFRCQGDGGPLAGLDITVSLQNVFNAKPQRIATNIYSDTAFDSTNYSAAGRVFSVSVLKKW